MTLHSHLRMDGAWRAYAPGERWAGRPAHLIRVVLRSARSVAVGYHLHEVALIPTADEEQARSAISGPDLLGADWDPAEAVRRIAAQPDATIAEALLDQRNLAGVGNLYKAETLFLRGLWPWTPVAAVPDLAGTVQLAQKLVASNRGRWTQTTTGSLRRGQTSYVYGRRAQPCRRCGTAIQKADQDERVTYWCPRCQPGSRRRGACRVRRRGGRRAVAQLGQALGDAAQPVGRLDQAGQRRVLRSATGWPSSAT